MNNSEVLELLQSVAAEFITPRFQSLARQEVREKSPGDLVTVADTEAEIAIRAELSRAYPEALIIGEEAVAANPALLQQVPTAEHWFTVDPVDGTKNFVHGRPDHAVMVAEMHGGMVQRSWIWQPQYERAYTAQLGEGAWCNGQPLSIDPTNRGRDLSSAPRGVSSRLQWVGLPLEDYPPFELSWVCCGVDYPQLIAGGADYIVYESSNSWDHAPGALLLQEAGGILGWLNGSIYDPRRQETPLIAAATPKLFRTVSRRIKRLPSQP